MIALGRNSESYQPVELNSAHSEVCQAVHTQIQGTRKQVRPESLCSVLQKQRNVRSGQTQGKPLLGFLGVCAAVLLLHPIQLRTGGIHMLSTSLLLDTSVQINLNEQNS